MCQLHEVKQTARVGMPGLVRASFGCYNTVEEVDWFADRLACIAAGDIQGDYVRDAATGAYWPQNYQPDYEHYFALKPGLTVDLVGMVTPFCGG
jgi:hypothetical protein